MNLILASSGGRFSIILVSKIKIGMTLFELVSALYNPGLSSILRSLLNQKIDNLSAKIN